MFSYVVAGCQTVLSWVFGTVSEQQDSQSVKVFIVGATGYVGGAVLALLLASENAKRFDVTVLSRSAEKARAFESFGVKAIVGSLDDLVTLEGIAAESDVVIECADADHIASTKAFLAGLRKKYETTGKAPILVHTSGTAVLSDNAAGMHSTDVVYCDADPEQLDAIAPTQPHRNVDLTVIAGDKEGTARYVKTFIVLPSTIYGLASGPLVDAGIVNPRSMQIPALIEASMDRRQAGMVGAGQNFHPNVHIDDVAQLYCTIVERALAGDDIGHGREGFYFGENGEHTMLDIAQTMGADLAGMGLADTADPSTFNKTELDKYFGGSNSLGTNVRCRAERSRGIGWKPAKTSEDMLASIKPEIEHIIAGRKLNSGACSGTGSPREG
ncbi:NAD-P-binding protein [Trametes versicolor FP-101664 SS1]|uniref:NAD-P-binding protein n=1 Tax=Trametes versicolor (strain FP-101664) TaxID=717944 RepID=UPI00046237CF|nr:NAD-P-binding protein [Trametes versicolor FP-101664 SS1]EIW57397.1 NAD-P-binding protein [Trametes versicolor FP-101664 SS1]